MKDIKVIKQDGEVFPDKKYRIIYADPPWKYKRDGNGSAAKNYNVMDIKDICNLPVKDIAEEKAHLYLWVTNPFISEGLKVCESWGFEYKTLITWVKTYKDGTPEMGMGYYFRGCTEHIIFGVKGGMKCLTSSEKNIVIERNPKQHSRKPWVFREKIVNDWSGDLPRIELFARKQDTIFGDELLNGWDCWGNEAPGNCTLPSS